MQASLKSLETFLTGKGHPTQVVPETEISPEQLILLLMKDPSGEDIALQLSLTEEGPLKFLQFFLLIPLQIAEGALPEVARLILNINASFDLASFGVMEVSGVLYYRYVHIFESLSEEALMAVIASVEMLLDTLLPVIIPAAKGEKTVEQLQKETRQTLIDHEFQML